MCTRAFKCISELWILTFLFKLADSKPCRSYLPLAREILHWHGCPEVPATESGRAAEQPVHLFLQPNMAAHILYMFHVVWGNALPQIMGRHGAQHTRGTCSVHKAQSLLMPPDSYDRCMQHLNGAEWIVGPDRGYIGRDYLELNHVLHKTLMKISSAANWCMIFPQFLLSLFQKVKYCSNLNQEWKYTVSGHWVVFPCLHFHYIPVFSIYYETWVYFQDVLGLRNCLFVYLFIHFRALWLISDVLKGSFSKIKTMSQLWKRVFQGSSGFFFVSFFISIWLHYVSKWVFILY